MSAVAHVNRKRWPELSERLLYPGIPALGDPA